MEQYIAAVAVAILGRLLAEAIVRLFDHYFPKED